MSDYAQGFKDGFAAGLEEGKKMSKPQPRLDDYVFGARETCPKCQMRIDRVMGYVCASPNCPTFPKVTCGPTIADITKPMTGAIGSHISYINAAGSNGPAGTMLVDDNTNIGFSDWAGNPTVGQSDK